MCPFTACARTVSRVSAFGDRPELAMPISFAAFGSHTNAKQSPPSPQLVGSTNPSTALAATAASTADPPRFSIAIAVCVASGCAVPAAPFNPSAGDREAKLAPEGRSPAWTSGRMNRSAPAGWNFGRSGAVSGAAPGVAAGLVSPSPLAFACTLTADAAAASGSV